MNNEKIQIPENIPTFDLDVSIVPNLPHCHAENSGNAVCNPNDWYSMECFAGLGRDVRRFGIDPMDLGVTTKTMWVQVTIGGFGEKNLTDHGFKTVCPELFSLVEKKDGGMRHKWLMPMYLPETFLEGVEEGDVKSTYICRYTGSSSNDFRTEAVAKINWHFKMNGARYSSHGEFGPLLKKLLTRAKAFRINYNH